MTGQMLEGQLAAAGPRLTERVLAEMYRDPFWSERFGERGRRHAGRDGDFHIQYLVEALAARDPGIFAKYATWLREVLVSRGMCSRHLAENYDRLAQAINEESWPDRKRAIDILRAGAGALTYLEGDAGKIDAQRVRIAAAVANAVGATPDDVDHVLSFLADALWFERRELFVRYIEFLAGSWQRHGVPAARLRALLDEVVNALGALGTTAAPAAYIGVARGVVPP